MTKSTEYDKTQAYCGVYGAKFKAAHPFNPACYWHDCQYDNHPAASTRLIDLEFLHQCLDIADALYNAGAISGAKYYYLTLQAHSCYAACRVWGKARVVIARLRGKDTLL